MHIGHDHSRQWKSKLQNGKDHLSMKIELENFQLYGIYTTASFLYMPIYMYMYMYMYMG